MVTVERRCKLEELRACPSVLVGLSEEYFELTEEFMCSLETVGSVGLLDVVPIPGKEGRGIVGIHLYSCIVTSFTIRSHCGLYC